VNIEKAVEVAGMFVLYLVGFASVVAFAKKPDSGS
jgi:hypothetical protein